MIFAIIMGLVGLAVVFWIIGFGCGTDVSFPPIQPREIFPRTDFYSWEYDSLSSKVSRLEVEVKYLKAELLNQRMGYITRYPDCLMDIREKAYLVNKDLCATKKSAEEKIEELQKIIRKI
mgnify:CR=1 FL=1